MGITVKLYKEISVNWRKLIYTSLYTGGNDQREMCGEMSQERGEKIAGRKTMQKREPEAGPTLRKQRCW